jgi:hypothetical protein
MVLAALTRRGRNSRGGCRTFLLVCEISGDAPAGKRDDVDRHGFEVADLKYLPFMTNVKDWCIWAAPGPASGCVETNTLPELSSDDLCT